MEQEIKINLNDSTCDITIKGLPLWRIHTLSTMPESVAEQMERVLSIAGVFEEKAERLAAKALAGKLTPEDIS